MLALREEQENRFASHGTYVPLFFIYDMGMYEVSEKKKTVTDAFPWHCVSLPTTLNTQQNVELRRRCLQSEIKESLSRLNAVLEL